MLTTDDPLLLRTQDARGVITLTLNRPQAFNALSEAMLTALQAELDATLNPPRQLTPMRRVSETGVTGGVLSDVKARWRRVFGKAE